MFREALNKVDRYFRQASVSSYKYTWAWLQQLIKS